MFTPPAPGPPPPSGKTSPFILVVALLGLGALLVIAAAGVFIVLRAADTTPAASASPAAPDRHAKLPPIERHVPHHDPAILEGCSAEDVRVIGGGIGSAIGVGAPLYNAGDFAGCYHMYEGTAADLERKLGATCAGPRGALRDGRKRAASLDTPGAQAWAMRDAFDGLLEVIDRGGR